VLWSKNSVGSQFVRDEAAEGQNGRLVPVLIEAVRPPLGFRQLQRADLNRLEQVSRRTKSSIDWWTSHSGHRAVEPVHGSIAGGSVGAAECTCFSGPGDAARRVRQLAEQDNRELVQGQRGWVDNLQRALGFGSTTARSGVRNMEERAHV
jgi:hypothetical protein